MKPGHPSVLLSLPFQFPKHSLCCNSIFLILYFPNYNLRFFFVKYHLLDFRYFVNYLNVVFDEKY